MAKLSVRVSRCIYCGAGGELSDEHVIPLGLGGDLILPSSSCATCRDLTSKFEGRVLRGFMKDARNIGDFPSRRKKKRPTSVSTGVIEASGATIQREVDVSSAIGFIHLPEFAPSSFLSGTSPVRGARIQAIDTLRFGKTFEEFVGAQGVTGLEDRARIDVAAFTRMLAKIAYSFLVGTTGQFERRDSPALGVLLAETEDPSNWLGSVFLPPINTSPSTRHSLACKQIKLESGQTATVVVIKLFATSGACTYEVVTRSPGWRDYAC